MSAFPIEVFGVVCSYLSPDDLLTCRCLNSSWKDLIERHPIWRTHVLKDFGYKYENYAIYLKQAVNWYFLYRRICVFIKNVKGGIPKMTFFPLCVRPLTKNYEGAAAITADGDGFLWENGEFLQSVSLVDGSVVWETSVAARPRDRESHPCIVNTAEHIFLHLNQRIFVYSLKDGSFAAELKFPKSNPTPFCNSFPLDISIRNQQLTFLTYRKLYVWDSHSLEFLFQLSHEERTMPSSLLPSLAYELSDLDFLWSGYSENGSGLPGESGGRGGAFRGPQRDGRQRDGRRRDGRRGGDDHFGCPETLQSRHFVLWLKRSGMDISVFGVKDSSLKAILAGHDATITRVRQTPSPDDLFHYFLASIDRQGSVRIWSSDGFRCIHKIPSGLGPLPFRLCLTSTHFMTLNEYNDNISLTTYKFHPPSTTKIAEIANEPSDNSEEKIGTHTNDTPPPSSSVLSDESLTTCRPGVYFADVIDNKLLGVWYSHPTLNEDRDISQFPHSDWEVFQYPLRSSSDSPARTPQAVSPAHSSEWFLHMSSKKRTSSMSSTVPPPIGENSAMYDEVQDISMAGEAPMEDIEEEAETPPLRPSTPPSTPPSIPSTAHPLNGGPSRDSFGEPFGEPFGEGREVVSREDLEVELDSDENEEHLLRCAGSPSERGDALYPRRAFGMQSRADTWGLLDWKSLVIKSDGSIVCYDFCPL